jgi:hypothetical protein
MLLNCGNCGGPGASLGTLGDLEHSGRDAYRKEAS